MVEQKAAELVARNVVLVAFLNENYPEQVYLGRHYTKNGGFYDAFLQGGIEPCDGLDINPECLKIAAQREAREEIGLEGDDFRIIHTSLEPIRYTPPQHKTPERLQQMGIPYTGQVIQTVAYPVIAQTHLRAAEVQARSLYASEFLDGLNGDMPEFPEHRWVDFDEVLASVDEYKREAYQQMEELVTPLMQQAFR